jgi:hypothetical protein
VAAAAAVHLAHQAAVAAAVTFMVGQKLRQLAQLGQVVRAVHPLPMEAPVVIQFTAV